MFEEIEGMAYHQSESYQHANSATSTYWTIVTQRSAWSRPYRKFPALPFRDAWYKCACDKSPGNPTNL